LKNFPVHVCISQLSTVAHVYPTKEVLLVTVTVSGFR
jgi:hypothetical protein